MKTQQEIQDWSVNRISTLLDIPQEKVDPNLDFDRLGLDSAIAVSLLVDLEGELGIEVPPTLLFEKSNLAEIADHLASQLKEEQVA